MFRYFIFSILIHGLFYFLIQLSFSPQIIDDPIVSVSYFEPSKSPQTKNPVKMKVNSSSSNENQETKEQMSQPLTSAAGSATESPSSQDQAFDSQIVSEKPRILYQEKAPYPAKAKEARIEGPVKLSVTIDKSGKVIEVIVLEGPGYELNETAAAAMKNFRFSPAQKDGQNVAVRITYIYRFKLESR
jgi:TonB family protein